MIKKLVNLALLLRPSIVTAKQNEIHTVSALHETTKAVSDNMPVTRALAAWGNVPYPVGILKTSQYKNTSTSAPGIILTDDPQTGWLYRIHLLNEHNRVRTLEGKISLYMLSLVWDFNLEAYAKNWAIHLCKHESPSYFEHSPDNHTGYPYWPFRISMGENLYAANWDFKKVEDIFRPVEQWYQEKKNFNWTTGEANATGAERVIGHFKQLAHPEVSSVGCAVVTGCHANQPGGFKTYVVCHYDYPNMGKLPHPYIEPHEGCLKCPKGFECCESNLCTGQFSDSNADFKTFTKPSQVFSEFGECPVKHTLNCAASGGFDISAVVKAAAPGLRFNNCFCGGSHPVNNSHDLIQNKVGFFRNVCFKLSDGGNLRKQDAIPVLH